MKRYLLLLALAWLTCMATPALAGDGHSAHVTSVAGDTSVQQHDSSGATGGTTLWTLLGRLLSNTTAENTKPAAMYMGSGYTSGYAISARTCELLGRESQLFKSVLDNGKYTYADLSEASVTGHARKAGIARYSPAFWTITTSRLVATNPTNAHLSPQEIGKKMHDLCMHKFLGEEIAYQ
jgi:hypothetical protein